MTTSPVDAAALTSYTFREPCRQCRRRVPALVVFDRECRAVIGEHYHRECLACGARWLEQCAPEPGGWPRLLCRPRGTERGEGRAVAR